VSWKTDYVMTTYQRLNVLPECADAATVFATTGIAPKSVLKTTALPSGTHLFQGPIHPWMRPTVVAH